MQVSIVSGKTYWRYRKLLKVYPSRRAAFRAAKRYLNLPMSRQPDKVVYPYTDRGDEYGLDSRNVRLYIFYLFIGALAIEYHIREDKPVKYGRKDGAGDQLPHFNSGKHPGKKKDHRYWEK
jgi:hypothetical protein